jgi:putative RecB family exonuclease
MPRSYSNSRIETFENCPRQYKFQYIEKASVEKPVAVEAFLGDAVHRALERLYQSKINGRVESMEEVLRYYNDHWQGPEKEHIKVVRDQLGVEDYIRVGKAALSRYYEQYHPFDDGDVIALEKNISFPLDPAGRFMIRAKIDRISRRKDGVVEIIDYKTKAFLPTQQSLNEDRQMGLYHIGVKHLWPDFERIELKQLFLRQGCAMTAMMDTDKLEEIRYGAFQKILEIERAVREDSFPPTESPLCDWCVYFELCPAKRHKLALEDEISDEFDAERGERLADEYLALYGEKKRLESRLAALRDDIIKYCTEADITSVGGRKGSLKLSLSEGEAFPTKSDSEEDYLALTMIAREAGLEEVFKLEPGVLYKEFYARERLGADLMEKLKKYLIRKRQATLRVYGGKEE